MRDEYDFSKGKRGAVLPQHSGFQLVGIDPYRHLTEEYLAWMNDSEVTRWLNSETVWSREELRAFLKRCSENPDIVMFAIVDGGGTHIGNIKLERESGSLAHLGLVLDKRAWGRGIGTNAIKKATRAAFDSGFCGEIEAGCLLENGAAIGAFQKAGYAIKRTDDDRIVLSMKNGKQRA